MLKSRCSKYVLITAIVLCGICAFLCVITNQVGSLEDADKAAIETRYQEFCSAYMSKNYETIYSYTSTRYRQAHSFQEYINQQYPNLPALDSNALANACYWHKVHGSSNYATLYHYLDNALFYEIYSGPVVGLVKENGEWYISSAGWSTD